MIIIGHRGARGLAPENTLASLRKAIQHGVDEVEFDVRVTKDHKVVLLHDPHLVDAAGNSLQLIDHTFEELLQHKPDLTLLSDALTALGPKTPLYIDVKPGVELAPFIKIIRHALQHGFTAADLRLASFSQSILRQLHHEFPAITMVVIEPWSGVRGTWRARQVGTKRIAMNQRWLWWGFVGPMSRSGWQLTPYTVNNPRQARNWKKYGLYGVVTDYPDRFER